MRWGVWSPQQSGQNILDSSMSLNLSTSPSLEKFSSWAKHNFNPKTPAVLGLIFFLKTLLRLELHSSQYEPTPYIFSADPVVFNYSQDLSAEVLFYYLFSHRQHCDNFFPWLVGKIISSPPPPSPTLRMLWMTDFLLKLCIYSNLIQ